MHIPDGILPPQATGVGYAVTAAATWYSIRKLKQKDDPRQGIPKAALLTAAFFVASWIHIPVPPTSIHLVLSGLLGALLGYYAFPAILIGLALQAVMFGHGGLTTLGINAAIIGLPALAAHQIFRMRQWRVSEDGRKRTGAFGFLAAATATAMSVALFLVILLNNLPADMNPITERAAIIALGTSHIPLIFIEGTVTALVTTFLFKVRPRMLNGV